MTIRTRQELHPAAEARPLPALKDWLAPAGTATKGLHGA